jgi:hypothetical protein
MSLNELRKHLAQVQAQDSVEASVLHNILRPQIKKSGLAKVFKPMGYKPRSSNIMNHPAVRDIRHQTTHQHLGSIANTHSNLVGTQQAIKGQGFKHVGTQSVTLHNKLTGRRHSAKVFVYHHKKLGTVHAIQRGGGISLHHTQSTFPVKPLHHLGLLHTHTQKSMSNLFSHLGEASHNHYMSKQKATL